VSGHADGAAALLFLLLLAGCRERDPALDGVGSPRTDVEEGVTSMLRMVPADTVQGRSGPSGEPLQVALRRPDVAEGHSRRIGMETFQIALRIRTPDRTQYPCTSCHVAGGVVVTPERIEDAHRDIQPVHPAETGATCGTCHAADQVDRLVLFSGERLTLDHAYRLCAQCHFTQVNDWAVGAHGKRLDGWRGPRIIMGCADCHDPHSPALEARVPYPGPHLPARTGGGH
jgi:hypothetical protein